jgi:hypothetical protein
MVTWILIAVAVLALGIVVWRLERRMDRHGITGDPVAGNPHAGQTSAPKVTDTGGTSL